MYIREFNDTTQSQIIAELDNIGDNEMGLDLQALIALSARQVVSTGKPNQFITEFAETVNINVKNWLVFAERILSELYPLNVAAWAIYDDINTKRIENSAWLKNQHLVSI